MQPFSHFLNPIFQLFFPNLCNGCGDELLGNEKVVCSTCIGHMPQTKFHLIINNPLEQKFIGRLKVENATSMYYFNKGGVIQNLLHGLKYKQKQEIGLFLGNQFARQIENVSWIKDIDLIVPIPLSKEKLRARGFNQSECIAQSLSAQLNIPLDHSSVVRNKNTESQTHKTRLERLSNVQDAFEITNSKAMSGKHILLIDDVITTGATLEECAMTILQAPHTKVSIATLAYAVD